MAIRLKSVDSAAGRVVSVLGGVTAALSGAFTAAPNRTGVIGSTLANLVSLLVGQYQSSSSHTGTISASLAGVTASIQATTQAGGGTYFYNRDFTSADLKRHILIGLHAGVGFA